MIKLLERSDHLVRNVDTRFHRYLFRKIDWSNRLIGIKGSRGTGKTTLLLQRLYQLGLSSSKAAYFTLDDLYFSGNNLVETGEEFYKNGGQYLFLDEVHKYPGWSREIKNLYDLYPDFNIVFTGSSVIDISRQEFDLSRRVLMYDIPGLSYREFLKFENIADLEAVNLGAILSKPSEVVESLPSGFRPLEHFKRYLQYGYYPFFREDIAGYPQRLQQLVRIIVEYDMAEIKGFDIRNAKKLLQLISLIASTVPFKPNLKGLAEKTGIHRNSLGQYLYFLEEARLLHLLQASGRSTSTLRKPEKVYLNNVNLLTALTDDFSIGTVRETFFASQTRPFYEVTIPPRGDFQIQGNIFEVGGRRKKEEQILGLENAWIIKDDLVTPMSNVLPLWIFGLLY